MLNSGRAIGGTGDMPQHCAALSYRSGATEISRRHVWVDVNHQRAGEHRGGAGLDAAPQRVPPTEEVSPGRVVAAAALALSHARIRPWGSALEVI